MEKLLRLTQVFKPGTPIQVVDLFAGRFDQITTLYQVLGQPGQHAALFGERGVGKTSLANIIGDSFQGKSATTVRSVRVACDTKDTYQTLFAKVLDRMRMETPEHEVTPDLVFKALSTQSYWPLVVIDELDRFGDDDGLSLLADTLKNLSDEAVPCTVLLVGVGDSVAHLVGDHRSVSRSLIQVPMPRMTARELAGIVDQMSRIPLRIGDSARRRIAQLSEGLPYYTHLLCHHAARRAIEDDRDSIDDRDVDHATRRAVEKAQQSILDEYERAVRSPRRDHLFGKVILACALAAKDPLGWFTPRAVRDRLVVLVGRADLPFSSFSRHMNAFASELRGDVLQRGGAKRNHVYRFSEPVMQTYVVLRGISDQVITEEQLAAMRPREKPGDDGELPS
jgi:Cdc6-like AAA superfamily ATPase